MCYYLELIKSKKTKKKIFYNTEYLLERSYNWKIQRIYRDKGLNKSTVDADYSTKI